MANRSGRYCSVGQILYEDGSAEHCERCHADLNAANNIAGRDPATDFDTSDWAAVRSDGPKSRPKAGRSGRIVLPDNPVTPRQDTEPTGAGMD